LRGGEKKEGGDSLDSRSTKEKWRRAKNCRGGRSSKLSTCLPGKILYFRKIKVRKKKGRREGKTFKELYKGNLVTMEEATGEPIKKTQPLRTSGSSPPNLTGKTGLVKKPDTKRKTSDPQRGKPARGETTLT